MTGATEPPIVIVGAGIVGVQLARDLQTRGCRVCLLDKDEPGMATSYGNAGYIATDEIFPLAHGKVLRNLPRMLANPLGPLSIRWSEFPRLLPWYLRYVAACSSRQTANNIETLADIQGRARDGWLRVSQRDGLSDLLRDRGAWKLFETERGFAQTTHERDLQRQYGIDCVEYSRDEMRRELPEVGPSVRRAVHYPNGMSTINSLALTNAIFHQFIADGGIFRRDRIEALVSDGRRVDLISSAGETIACDRIVIAAGHLSGRLLKPLGLTVPIVAERGYHIEISHTEIGFDMPVGCHERGFYMTPMTSGLRLAGTTEFSSADHDTEPNWARAEILKRHIDDILPGVMKKETGRWMGNRPTLADFLPALGALSDFDNLFVAFGHHHLGLTLSAITAEAMGALLTTGEAPFDLSRFSLARFQ